MVEMKTPVAGYNMTLDISDATTLITSQINNDWLPFIVSQLQICPWLQPVSAKSIPLQQRLVKKLFSKIGIDETDNKFQSIF